MAIPTITPQAPVQPPESGRAEPTGRGRPDRRRPRDDRRPRAVPPTEPAEDAEEPPRPAAGRLDVLA